MPRLVADQIPWHSSAAILCVGQSEHPKRIEWELRSGASLAAIDSGASVQYHNFTQKKTGEGDRTSSYCHPVSFVRKSRAAAAHRSFQAADITSERRHILEHPPQGQVRVKTGAPTRIGATAFSFEWIASGLTAVCFWTALRRLIAALEGPVRFRLALGSTLARLSPNRCLAGLQVRAA